jgi:hypothetical protein
MTPEEVAERLATGERIVLPCGCELAVVDRTLQIVPCRVGCPEVLGIAATGAPIDFVVDPTRFPKDYGEEGYE